MLDKTKLDAEHQLLADAADWIELNGWWDGRSKCSFPTACAVQAIVWADNKKHGKPLFHTSEFAVAVQDIFAKFIGLNPISIPRWNDQSDMTKERVIEALREAAYSFSIKDK